MGTCQNQRVIGSRCLYMLMLLFVLHEISHGNIEARRIDNGQKGLEHEGTVKTIDGDYGDTIDCVDINKQPSLKHPLIKDIKMEPGSYPHGMKMDNSRPPLSQDWHRFGECPHGTIPIRRTIPNDGPILRPTLPFASQGKNFNRSHSFEESPTIEHQFAAVGIKGNLLQSVQGSINLWNPKVEQKAEFSSSQISLANDINLRGKNLTTIQAGWIVHPQRYKNSDTRFFIYWKNDANELGCYDYDCPGFVQTSSKIGLGARFTPVSTYGKPGWLIDIYIYKERKTNDWWLQVNDETIGYWPSSMFPNLRDGADLVTWGGEIVNLRSFGHHTTTQMGSGHFSDEGYEKASYIRGMKVRDITGTITTPTSFLHYVSDSDCYSISVKPDPNNKNNTYVFYGGPGYSKTCR